MSEQPTELQRINWTSCLTFTQLFRTFRIALHPGKLALALAAILATGLWGWFLDSIWMESHRPLTREVHAFWQQPNIDRWRDRTLAARPQIIERVYQAQLGQAAPSVNPDDPALVSKALEDLRSRYEQAAAAAPDEATVTRLARQHTDAYREVAKLRRAGVFRSFLAFETDAIRQFINSAATLNLAGGIGEVMHARHAGGTVLRAGLDPAGAGVLAPTQTGVGALPSLILMARGVQWLIEEHPLFAVLFGLGKLAIWALLGGAICRMAALNYARDERIPLRAALSFAWRKYLGFLTAPLLPIAMIAVVGVLLWLGGLLCAIPHIGGILLAIGMGPALLGGFVLALVLIGFLGGGSLMWPTVAVEGSDSFDAMSRSYSYVYTRPWKTAFYVLVASVYGALCYLFVRFFAWVALRATRTFLAAGIAVKTARPGAGVPGATRMDAMWPIPTFDTFWQAPPPFARAHWDDWIGMVVVAAMVFLVILTVCAFLATFYFSAWTIIYYLLRREVDSTDLEDVYTEGEEDESAGESPSPSVPAGEGPAPAAET